jgi:hypothetical protein
MLGPFLLPFSAAPVALLDDGADTKARKKYEYLPPVPHYVNFRGKTFEYSYSFAAFILKTVVRDYRAAFSSKSFCFSDSRAAVYARERISSVVVTDCVVTKGGVYYRQDFNGVKDENVFKDSSKATFIAGSYDNRHEMEDAAILFHLSINL